MAPWCFCALVASIPANAADPAMAAGPAQPRLLAADDAAAAMPTSGDPGGQRQAQVAQRGAEVMPFALAVTTHIFTKTASGGVQQVIAKDAADDRQAELVREHLRDMRARFLAGDFSGPAHIHGQDMPGLARLQAARPGQLSIVYREVPGGAELEYRSHDTGLIAALHDWFDAQLADHGADAMAGHHHP